MRNKILFRSLVLSLFLALLLSSTMMSACSPQETTGTTGTSAAGTTATSSNQETKEEVTIRLLSRYTGTDATTESWNEDLKIFQEMYPYIKIQDESVNQPEAYDNKIKVGFATGDLPNVFYIAQIASLPEYAKNGMLMDVTEIMEDKEWFDGFIDGIFETFNFEAYGVKGYYAVPHSVAPEVFVYNTDLFEQAGIKSTPKTMDEFYDVIDKLNAIGVIPWAVGGQDGWRIQHFHNAILYKWMGVPSGRELGNRSIKWTDPEIVKTIQVVKDLKARGAFDKNVSGIDYEMEKIQFLSGQAAMVFNGNWFVGECVDSELHDKFATFDFPAFSEKPQFANHVVNYSQHFLLKGGMEGAEKEATIEFIKFYTSKDRQERRVEMAARMPSRKDVDLSAIQLSHVYKGYVDVANGADMVGGDSFEFDPIPSMMDRIRNSFVGMFIEDTPAADIAAQIQQEIDTKGN